LYHLLEDDAKRRRGSQWEERLRTNADWSLQYKSA
jgi:hypothetical protein